MGLIDTLLGHASEKNLDKLAEEFGPLLAPGEQLQRAFGLIRDLMVFTDRRLVLVNKQGVTGSKVEYRGMDIIPIREGLVARKDVYSDGVTLLRQLGLTEIA